ncbi:MAG: 1-(5-phosphoribosyl)-5-[(5-phosphoribosylamino)methylideneamino]imidazole-4-carboxamide isomerase [Chloroflexia bacterium]|nr:1-(5-phosphoribosyl)-5-[(5-phosphoribosylamino)methylideneamino]imidazole-4-carboxamide isomerase [Chloroflexia bacterium]
MIVYPAIDIRNGKAVRLVEGDFDRETIFDADPVDAALRWQEQGAEWIHIVDLDGARDGVRANEATIRRIRSAVPVKLQLGGGLRDMDALSAAHEMGIERLVIGSAAVSNPELIPAAVAAFGGAIAVGLDARDGRVATRGWTEQTSIDVMEIAQRVADEEVEHIVYTDIGRDGRLEGPNLAALEDLVARNLTGIIASGGIGSLDDIANVARTGASGVIIGAALYHRSFTLTEALKAARQAQGVRS